MEDAAPAIAVDARPRRAAASEKGFMMTIDDRRLSLKVSWPDDHELGWRDMEGWSFDESRDELSQNRTRCPFQLGQGSRYVPLWGVGP